MLTHKEASMAAVNALMHNVPFMLLIGVITLAAGLAMVLAHNIWSGGAVPVLVTLVGWITLVKGLLFLFLPPEAMAGLYESLHYQQLFPAWAAIAILIGAYLTYGGFGRDVTASSRR
jgi:vacuolar-type H+-ATPase subunit I/STV1